MYKTISENFKLFKFILCVGETRIKKDKQKLKLLQEEYNCYIIENVVTDFLLLNYILDSMQDEYVAIDEVSQVKYASTPPQREVQYSRPAVKETYESLARTEDVYVTPPLVEESYESLARVEEAYVAPPLVEESYESLSRDEEVYVPLHTEEVPSVAISSTPTSENYDPLPPRIVHVDPAQEDSDFDFGELDKKGDSSQARLDSSIKNNILTQFDTPKAEVKTPKSNVVSIDAFAKSKQTPEQDSGVAVEDEDDDDHEFE